jgi:hypothetical protein
MLAATISVALEKRVKRSEYPSPSSLLVSVEIFFKKLFLIIQIKLIGGGDELYVHGVEVVDDVQLVTVLAPLTQSHCLAP